MPSSRKRILPSARGGATVRISGHGSPCAALEKPASGVVVERFVLGAGAALRGSILMSEQSKLATIECVTCSALLEVCPQDVPDEPSRGWSALDDGHFCQAPPLRRCPHARAEIKLRFPTVDLKPPARRAQG
jgi:hypothetical protein